MTTRLSRILLIAYLIGIPASAHAANIVTWEPGNSLIDTTNYSAIGPYYWFSNFANPSPITGAAVDDHEARNLPSWVHLETRPAYIGKDDSGLTSDSNSRTGFSFVENAAGTIGDTSIGGQPGFNTLTLPGGVTGVSGEAADSLSVTGNTSSYLQIRILAGAPDSFRLWVVTDNGSGANFQDQARIRVNLRDTTGAPLYVGDSDVSEVEALPSGVRIGQTAVSHNGTADAWSFLLSGVNTDDIITIRPTSAAGSLPAVAGLLIAPVPEPSSIVLLALGAICSSGFMQRRHRD